MYFRVLIDIMQNQYFTTLVDTVSSILDSIHIFINKWLIGPLLVLAIYDNYKLSISAKPISAHATPSLNILIFFFELDIIQVYFVLYQTSKRNGTRMILIDNIYQE